ncbi:hypothetical protein M427DRAFT_499975 [Gonapodya prolifera JEL478]|uniref:Uncharacterized protein n=1 Tax=Gonapodya prolifera (strain JEL478) TaxID=1344416 RepID=A0A139AA34_GONPJ|nr:hypothetical protein M427DRAFT_499975 [Gonapodya prolifera JEL478]|eukprot:KXS13712.1 hypothetical protein M427DRAFT_499975 [Gonapodya prolifera JEL478]
MSNLFSVPIFFVVFRETLEASIIISILLALANQLVGSDVVTALDPKVVADVKLESPPDTEAEALGGDDGSKTALAETSSQMAAAADAILLRRLKIQIFARVHWSLAFAILWGAAEDLREGIFSLVACIFIYAYGWLCFLLLAVSWVMGLAMLSMDRAKIKWRIKLRKAFAQKALTEGALSPHVLLAAVAQHIKADTSHRSSANAGSTTDTIKSSRSSKCALFLLPCTTVLREGLEAVVFVGPIGELHPHRGHCGCYLSIFLVVSTAFLLLLGAGLFSKAVGDFERYKYSAMVGADVAEADDGPESYSVHGNVCYLNCFYPENKKGS